MVKFDNIEITLSFIVRVARNGLLLTKMGDHVKLTAHAPVMHVQ